MKFRSFNLLQTCRCPKGSRQSPPICPISSHLLAWFGGTLCGLAPSPRASFLEPECRAASAGCPCRAPRRRDTDSPPQQREESCVACLRFPGFSWGGGHVQAWAVRSNRLELQYARGREPAQPRVETQAPSLAECGHEMRQGRRAEGKGGRGGVRCPDGDGEFRK